MELGRYGAAGDAERMMRHASDYLDLFSTVAIAWQWLEQAAAARDGLAKLAPGASGRDEGFYRAKLAAAQYWIRTELPRIDHLARLCSTNEDSYALLDPEWL
jgi:butyryl-CoA dehydrogenase